jgi:hypothetical protein
MAGQRLSCLREEWAKPRGRKSRRRHCGKAIEAQPSLWPDRVIDETASSRARRPAGKVMRPMTPQEPASRSEKSQTRARKDTSIPEPCLAEKCSLQRCSVRQYRRALPCRRGNSAFAASLTAEGAGHHPIDDEADDSIPDDVAFRTICVLNEGNPKASLQQVAGARRAMSAYAPPVKTCRSLGKWPPLAPTPYGLLATYT